MKTLLLLMPWALIGCERPDSTPSSEGGWTRVGRVADVNSVIEVWKIKDKDSGDTIYATTKGGVFVVKAKD